MFLYQSDYGFVYLVDHDPCGLPTTISGSYNYSYTKSVIESEQFTIDIVDDLKSKIGWESLSDKILSSISSQINVDYEALDLLYPSAGEDALVQWAVVCTPLVVNTANAEGGDRFWITRDNTTDADFPSLEVIKTETFGSVSYLMDAYAQAWYNGITNNMLKSSAYRDKLIDLGLSTDYIENGIGGSSFNSGKPIQSTAYGGTWGQITKEFGKSNFNKIADIAYVDPDQYANSHCLGIESPRNIGGDWHDDVTLFARYGGITVALSKFNADTTDTPPLYYHIYYYPDDILPEGFDPDDPDFDLLKDIPEPTPTVTVSPTKVTDPYNPSSDPNMPGYPVAIQAPKPDGADPSPQNAYPNLPGDKCRKGKAYGRDKHI